MKIIVEGVQLIVHITIEIGVIGHWRFLRYCEEILDIRKMNTRYVCSKDRLEAIDFNIIRDYQLKYNSTYIL